MAPSTASTSLTDRDRVLVTRAREFAAAGDADALAVLVGGRDGADDNMVRTDALGVAQYLLAELADLAERLGGRPAPRLGGGDGAPGLGGHRRWHVKRGERNPDCRYCADPSL